MDHHQVRQALTLTLVESPAEKDRVVMSSKYQSKLQVLRAIPHVVVFCNEQPDLTTSFFN